MSAALTRVSLNGELSAINAFRKTLSLYVGRIPQLMKASLSVCHARAYSNNHRNLVARSEKHILTTATRSLAC
jgi:hypothetical protein